MAVRFEISVSLDGFVTAAAPTPDEPMGAGGQRLLEWGSNGNEVDHGILVESQASVGASIAGRRTYDLSIPWWQSDGPGGDLRTPTFIVSHGEPDEVPADGVYTFASSPQEALDGAIEAAGEKDVDVFSASVGQQLLRAGAVDEVRLHIAPVMLGAGTPLFEAGAAHVQLEPTEVIAGTKATHVRYRVLDTGARA